MSKNRILSNFLGLLAVTLPFVVFAYQNPGQPQGYVNDFAGVLKAPEIASLGSELSAFTSSTGNEIAVATIKNLGGDTIENFAASLFKDWGIGKKGKDNGALVLIAVDDHKMRIEVGYGLEPYLTDSQSGAIINGIMKPAFRANDFYGGISGAVKKIIADVSPDYAANAGIPASQPMADNQSKGFDWSNIFLIIVFAPIWLGSILARSKSWWAGGVVGAIIGVVIGFIFGFFYFGIAAIVFLIPLGLLFDFIVSRAYGNSVGKGLRPPWWIGGGRGGMGGGFGGGGFGGFGGGGSGGGGSSGGW